MRATLMFLGVLATAASCEQKPPASTEARATASGSAMTATLPIDGGGAAVDASSADLVFGAPDPLDGGLGMRGSGVADGAGDGGTGIGATPHSTIGTGRFGTVTISSGTGQAPDRRGRPGPQLRFGTATIQGTLIEGVLRRIARRRSQQFLYCYEKQLAITPQLEGTVTLELVIAPTGKVTSTKASGMQPEVATCIATIAAKLEFPEPEGGGIVKVSYPMSFTTGTPKPR